MAVKFSPGCNCCGPSGPCPCGPVSTYIGCCGTWSTGPITNLQDSYGATQNGASYTLSNHGTTTSNIISIGSIASVGSWGVPTTSGTHRVEVIYTDENAGIGTPSYAKYWAWASSGINNGRTDSEINIFDHYCFGRVSAQDSGGGTVNWNVTGTDCSTGTSDYRCQNGCRVSAVTSITHAGNSASQDAGVYSKDRGGNDVWSFQTSSTASFSLRKLTAKWQIAAGHGNSGTGTFWEDIANSNVCNGTVNSTYRAGSIAISFTVTGATC